MAVYGNMILTQRGLALYSKAQTGVQINFTRLQVGSGKLAQGEDPTALTAIKMPIDFFAINSVTSNGNTANIKGIFENTNISASTYSCELGVFATDPDIGEILFAYANAGEQGDTIPPITAGPLSKQFRINVAIGNASNITATIPADTYVPNADKGIANGVATLGPDGKIPTIQLPSLEYVPTSEKGIAGGVATLDETGKIPPAQIPDIPLANIPNALTGKDADSVDGFHLNQDIRSTASPDFAGLTVGGKNALRALSGGFKIQSGSISLSCTQNQWVSATVPFPQAFASASAIVVTQPKFSGFRVDTTAGGVTSTGFTFEAFNAGVTATLEFAWIAIGI